MSGLVIPYLASLILGRVIQLSTYSWGPRDIFSNVSYTGAFLNSLESTYRVIQSAEDLYDFLHLPIDLVLRTKAEFLKPYHGLIHFENLLKRRWHEPRCLVALNTNYKMMERSIHGNYHLGGNGTLLRDGYWHYVKKHIFGDQIIVLYEFSVDRPEDFVHLRRIVKNSLGENGPTDEDFLGRWGRMKERLNSGPLRGNWTMTAEMMSSEYVHPSAPSPEALQSLYLKVMRASALSRHPNLYFIEVAPLADLDGRIPRLTFQAANIPELMVIDCQYDDIRATLAAFSEWNYKEELWELYQLVYRLRALYRDLIAQVSLYTPLNMAVLRTAQEAYQEGLNNTEDTYYKMFLRLKGENGL